MGPQQIEIEPISKMWIKVQGSRRKRDFASDLNILRCSKGAGRLKSGAYTAVREHFEPTRFTP
jgi:hypothetical protein